MRTGTFLDGPEIVGDLEQEQEARRWQAEEAQRIVEADAAEVDVHISTHKNEGNRSALKTDVATLQSLAGIPRTVLRI